MYLFVKLWTPKQAWHDLSLDQRIDYIKRAQEIMLSISATMDTIGWMEIVEAPESHNDPHSYCSVYKFYDKEDADMFHEKMVKFKWYDYFDQTNVVGKIESPGAVLQRVVSL